MVTTHLSAAVPRPAGQKRGLGATLTALALGLGLALGVSAVRAETALRIANVGEPTTLDPHLVSGDWEDRIVGDLFMGLTTEDAAGKAIPGAAESWTVSDDGLVYTFKLRDHVWSDGTPVSADDFVFALRRVMDPATAAEYASVLFTIKNAEEVNSGKAKPEELGVKALDAKTLEITLRNPAPYFIEQLTHYTSFPLPRHVVEKYGKEWTKKEHIVSNGAYMLKEWSPNSQLVMAKNPKFYDAANVKIDQVVYYPDEDLGAVLKRFRAGEIDVATRFPVDQLEWLKANMPEAIKLTPGLNTYYYPINTSKKPFDDKRIRQALAMAIDREALTDKVLKSGNIPAYSFVPPGTNNYEGGPAFVSWKNMAQKERLEKAKALLKEAGYGPDKPLKFTLRYNTNENHKRVAIAIAAMWKPLGVQAELFNSEVKVHYASLKQADFDVARAGWVADYNDPQNFLYLLETRTGPLNYGRFSNAEYDKLMQEAEQTLDLKTRAELMVKAEAIAMEELPIIPIYHEATENLVAPYVKGWIDNPKEKNRSRWLSIER